MSSPASEVAWIAEEQMAMLRLAQNPAVQMTLQALRARNQLTATAAAIGHLAVSMWANQLKSAIDYTTLIRHNNLNEGPKVAARVDVIHAVQAAVEAATDSALAQMLAAWESGTDLAAKHVMAESKALGIEGVVPVIPGGDSPELELLRKDVKNLGTDVQKRILAAAQADDWQEQLAKVQSMAQMRGRMITEAAVREGNRQTVIETFGGDDAAIGALGSKAMWIAKLDAKTCAHCAKLHGTQVEWGQPFSDAFSGLKPLGTHGPLLGPPRHPNCRCVLVPVL